MSSTDKILRFLPGISGAAQELVRVVLACTPCEAHTGLFNQLLDVVTASGNNDRALVAKIREIAEEQALKAEDCARQLRILRSWPEEDVLVAARVAAERQATATRRAEELHAAAMAERARFQVHELPE